MQLKLLPRRLLRNKVDLFLFVVFSVIFTVILFFVNEDLKIDHIELLTDEKVKNIKDKNIYGVGLLRSKNLIFIDENEVSHIIKTQNPLVKNVVVSKDYPNKLSIVLDFYQPLAYLQVSEGFFLLSPDGRILEKTKVLDKGMKQYPVIEYYQNFHSLSYQSGNFINTEDMIFTLYILKNAQDIGLNVKTVDIRTFNMIALYGDQINVYFSAEKDRELVVDEMRKIVKQLAREGTKFRVLNLRFDNPVIEF
jgi:cell division septal protein FtsQ